ncbi:MAG: chorismate mutase [Treponema sp.]|jgi:chorismate mutase|nr:chorismate mutase [Treponema sp.]
MKRLCALRGAIQCRNEEGDITRRVGELYDALLEHNDLEEGDIVSLLFSATPDIDALNPAAALRRTGRGTELALFVLQEAFFPGGPERIIRALAHCYLAEGRAPRHIYKNGAEFLRPNWGET